MAHGVCRNEHIPSRLVQDVAVVGFGNPDRAALRREYVRNDPINGIIGGWPFLEAAWLAKQ